jgi:DNA-binding transcriptional ArsR family regulator
MEEIFAENQNQNQDQCRCRCIHQERVDGARKHALADTENKRLVSLFKAMGDGNRLKILWALAESEMCVCDLAMLVGVSESAVSHQLRQLRQLQLVVNRREGPVLYYSLVDDCTTTLIRLALGQTEEDES